jgi:hypothetical protein
LSYISTTTLEFHLLSLWFVQTPNLGSYIVDDDTNEELSTLCTLTETNSPFEFNDSEREDKFYKTNSQNNMSTSLLAGSTSDKSSKKVSFKLSGKVRSWSNSSSVEGSAPTVREEECDLVSMPSIILPDFDDQTTISNMQSPIFKSQPQTTFGKIYHFHNTHDSF